MFSRSAHQNIYLACLLMAAFLMPVSVWLLSVVSIIMSANWLLEGNYLRKLRIIRTRSGVIMLLMLFAMYLVWLLNTGDPGGALSELKLKLPLLFFPVVIGSSGLTGPASLRLVLLSFITGCMVSVIAGFMALAGVLPVEISGPRDLALFVPSIRLSILLCFAIFSSLWLIAALRSGGDFQGIREQAFTGRAWAFVSSRRTLLRAGLAVAAAAMVFFLFRLLSVTGIVLFTVLLTMTGLFLLLALRRIPVGLSFMAAAATVTVTAIIIMHSATDRLHYPANPALNEPLDITPSGNSYTHYPEETLLENGYLVWMNVCEEELRREWNRRSNVDYDGCDLADNELRVTLIRYITAMGMPKDSTAVMVLTTEDISNIERGFANPVYARKGSLIARAYGLAWELDRASHGANPSGHSLTQRPEFYRAAVGIIKKHPWTGAGTGDVALAFNEEYASNETPLKPEYRLRAHNQYLTFALTFGIPGAMLAVTLVLMPWLTSPYRQSYLLLLLMTLILTSMLNDDTFSSFTGAAFFSYFYTLLIITGTKDETQY